MTPAPDPKEKFFSYDLMTIVTIYIGFHKMNRLGCSREVLGAFN